jgi:hypothetical protein
MHSKRPRWWDRTFYLFLEFRPRSPALWFIDRADDDGGDGIVGSLARLGFAFGWNPVADAGGLPVAEPLELELEGAGAVPAWERELDSFVREQGAS